MRGREDGRGTVMVANRTREMRPSGMTRGAYGNVNYGQGYTGTYRGKVASLFVLELLA